MGAVPKLPNNSVWNGVRSSRGCPGTQGGVVALRTEGGLVYDVGTSRSLRIISSTWSFRCVKCHMVCYCVRFPWENLRCMEMLGCDSDTHEDILIDGLEIITVRLLESSDNITE